MDIQDYLKLLGHLHDLQWRMTVDKFKFVCESKGIKEREAMKMYEHFMILAKGNHPYYEGKPVTTEYLERVIELAELANAEYEKGLQLSADLHNFEYQRWGSDFSHAIFLFEKDFERRAEEFNLAHADTYISVSLLLKGGWVLKQVIRQCDSTSSTRNYLGFSDDDRRNTKTLRIYDGDVFEVMPLSSTYSSNFTDCGMYLCHNGAYRKLLYIPGKGYVNNKKPMLDDDVLEININKEGLFNSHKLTWGAFRKVGNINVDMGCLVEKDKE